MKKKLCFLFLIVCAAAGLGAQNVLPDYMGFWEGKGEITVLDLFEIPSERLPYIRNEIYARYGRPFATKIYRDYFLARRWYREKANYTDAWLKWFDPVNAEFIRSLEQFPLSHTEVEDRVLQDIEYRNDKVVLTFTSRSKVLWSDVSVNFGAYAMDDYNAGTMSWLPMWNWILVFKYTPYHEVHFAAYKLDFASKKIVASFTRTIEGEVMDKLLESRDKSFWDYRN